jgi:hypothetical protein
MTANGYIKWHERSKAAATKNKIKHMAISTLNGNDLLKFILNTNWN